MGQSHASRRLRERVSSLELSQTDIAAALGKSRSWVGQSLLKDTEKVLRKLTREQLSTLLVLLQWDKDELTRNLFLDWGAPLPRPNIFTDEVVLYSPNLRYGTKPIPVYRWVAAGRGLDGEADILEWIDIPESWSGEYVGYVIHGSSMYPTIEDGDIIVVKLQDAAEKGEVIVCYTREEGMLLKELGECTPDGVQLVSHNEQHPPLWVERLFIKGVLVEVRRLFRKAKRPYIASVIGSTAAGGAALKEMK